MKDIYSDIEFVVEGILDPKDRVYRFCDFKGVNNETRPLELVVRTDDKSRFWHEELGHLNFRSMKFIITSNMVHGHPIWFLLKVYVRVVFLVNVTKKSLRKISLEDQRHSWSLCTITYVQ